MVPRLAALQARVAAEKGVKPAAGRRGIIHSNDIDDADNP